MKTRDKLKKKGQFVDAYWDRRAQAKYAAKNPDSMLAQGLKPEFTSRYADPNHPASSGNLFSLVTGGHFNPPSRRDMMMQQGRSGFGGFGGGLGAIAGRRDMMMGGGFGGRAGMMGQDPYHQYGGRLGGGLGVGGRGQMFGYGGNRYQQYDPRRQMLDPNASRRSMDEREYQQYDGSRQSSTTPEQRKSMDGRERSEYLDPNFNAYSGRQMNAPAPYGGGLGGLGGFNAPDLLKKGVKKVLGKVSLVLIRSDNTFC